MDIQIAKTYNFKFLFVYIFYLSEFVRVISYEYQLLFHDKIHVNERKILLFQ